MKKVFLACLLAVGLFGCAYNSRMGNEKVNVAAITEVVKKGQTRKEDLLAAFGPPQNVQIRSAATDDPKLPPPLRAGESWTYWNHRSTGTVVALPFYTETDTQYSMTVATFFFSPDGVVLDYSITQSR